VRRGTEPDRPLPYAPAIGIERTKEGMMSTRTANLPIERRYLVKVWAVVAAIVIAAAMAIALGLGQTTDASRSSKLPEVTQVTQVKDYGPAQPREQIFINGVLCAQCR
jgi:hypothetical protein